MKCFDWNEITYAQLSKMWDEGLTGKQIGDIMGCSRSAILSKARYLRLSKREPFKKERTPKPKVRVMPKLKVEPVKETAVLEELPPVALEDLDNHNCRFPVTEALYCGSRNDGKHPYCPAHARVMYQPTKPLRIAR